MTSHFSFSAIAGALLAFAALVAAPISPAHARPGEFERGYADLVEDLAPAVVNISTSQTVEGGNNLAELLESLPDGLRERFPDLGPNSPLGGRRAPRRRNSLGSGFVIDAEGVIVTNNHVVEGADEIVVNFTDGTQLPAEIVGRDEGTDIAVLRVESGRPLPAVRFGDSDDVRVGDRVLAIGNPFGLGGSVTEGIVSALSRQLRQIDYEDFIQTDAAINRGNSGGPLFNLDGSVIGVNTAIFSPSGGSIGISFSVPSNLASRVVRQLLEYGEVRRGWLGVSIRDVDQQIAQVYGLNKPEGSLVAQVVDGSPASDAGLEEGDLVVRFNGQSVSDSSELQRRVADTEIGATVPVEVLRKGDRRTFRVTVGRLDTEAAAAASLDSTSDTNSNDGERLEGLGVVLGSLESREARRFQLSQDNQGAVVLRVDAESDAAGKLREGDLITEVNWEPVRDVETARVLIEAALDSEPRKPVLLRVRRGDATPIYIAVEPVG